MDESTLRNYFRKALGVAPGVSRKELKACRDKRAQRWRSMLTSPSGEPGAQANAEQAEIAKLAEERLSMTNTAYDCLSNADKFRDFQSKLASGEAHLPDLDSLLSTLGKEVKHVAPRVLAKRQAQLQEKMERIHVLVVESVQKGGHDQALKMTQGKLPDADKFYDAVYAAAVESGKATCAEEIAALAQSKMEVDETFQSELDELIVDQAEIIAHKEYDRLEDRAAMSAPTPAMPRFVALTLTLIIMGLVVTLCLWGATSSPTSAPAPVPYVAPSTSTTMPVPTATDAGGALPNAATTGTGVPGIANSVFNRSTFGAPSSPTAVTPPSNPVTVPPAVPANGQGAASTANPAVPAPAPAVVPAGVVSVDEAKSAELAGGSGPVPAADIASGAGLVANAGNAGMAGLPAVDTRPGAMLYKDAVGSAMKGAFPESLAGFRQAYTQGKFREALYNEGVVLGVQGHYSEALSVYNKLLSNHPSFAQGLYNRALTHQLLAAEAWKAKNTALWQKHLNQAAANYDLAVKADPKLSQAYFNRGIVHYQLDQKDKAYDDFAKADSLLPGFMPAVVYNRDVVGMSLKKNGVPPMPAPACPLGPVGPPGPP